MVSIHKGNKRVFNRRVILERLGGINFDLKQLDVRGGQREKKFFFFLERGFVNNDIMRKLYIIEEKRTRKKYGGDFTSEGLPFVKQTK